VSTPVLTVQVILWLWTIAKAWDMHGFARQRYKV
jgi:hypothetical protein